VLIWDASLRTVILKIARAEAGSIDGLLISGDTPRRSHPLMCVEEMLWLNSSVCALIISKLEGDPLYVAAPGTGSKAALREYQSQPAVVGFDPARCRHRGWLFFSGASEPFSANRAG